jgi:hypothetical protein
MRKIAFLFFVFALGGAGPAFAAAPDAPGAAELKKLVESELQGRFDMAKVTGQGLTTTGAVAVAPKTSFYEVKIPGLSLTLGPEGRLEVGTVVINAVPGKDGEWMITLALPETMTVYEKQNTVIAKISLGSQSFKSAWIPSQGIYPRFDGLYKNIQIKGPAAEDFKISIGSLRLVSNLKDNGDSTLSGHSVLEAGDVSVDGDGKGTLRAALQRISFTNIYDRLDLGHRAEIREKIRDAAQAGHPPADAESAAVLGSLVSLTESLADNIGNVAEISGLVIRTKDAAHPNQPAEEIAVDNAVFRSTLKDAQQAAAAATFKGSINGIKLSSPSAGSLAALMPHTANIDISANNIPLKKIVMMLDDTLQQMVGTIKSTQKSPADAKNIMAEKINNLVFSLPRVLQNAGTSLSIQNTFVRSNEMETTLTGYIVANTTVPSGLTGKIILSVNGLESFIQKLQGVAADASMSAYTNGLTALTMVGQADKTADGKYIHNYIFEITSDNKVLLNNMNLQPLLDAGPAAPPAVK